MNDKPFGIDISRYQGKVDWDVVGKHKPKVIFAGIRASINDGYTDTWFGRNWTGAKSVGIARTAYHIVFPDTPAEKQMSHFLKVVGDDIGELPLTLDLELDHGIPYRRIADSVLECSVILERNTGRKPILYAEASWVDEHVIGREAPPKWISSHAWWIAHHDNTGAEFQSDVKLPRGVDQDQFLIHQTTSMGNPFGVESVYLHYNRWQGDYEHFLQFLHGNQKAISEQSLEDRLSALEEAARKHGWEI